jgi:hypothetical protein
MTTVSVTAEHIARGEPGDCGWCPIALAVADALPGLAYLSIRLQDIDLRPRPDEDLIVIGMPDEAVDFILDFDAGKPVKPFTFELDYPAVTP